MENYPWCDRLSVVKKKKKRIRFVQGKKKANKQTNERTRKNEKTQKMQKLNDFVRGKCRVCAECSLCCEASE